MTDYSEFVKYYYARERVSELLISLLFLIIVLEGKGRLFKAVAIFGFTVSFSSMIDKLFLQNFGYLYSDIIIMTLAFYLAFKTYRNESNPSRTKRLNN